MFRQTRVWRTRTNPDCLTFALAFDVRKSFENISCDVCRRRRVCVCVSLCKENIPCHLSFLSVWSTKRKPDCLTFALAFDV